MNRLIAALALLLVSCATLAQTQPTVTTSASPMTGACPLTSTITWSSTAAQSCSKTGAWSGTATLNGTATVTLQTGSATYGINCQTNTGPLDMTWVPPTTNSDGSALTNLAGYDAYTAPTQAGVATATPVQVAIGNSATIVVPIGPRYAGLKARNTAGAQSTLSNIAGPTTVVPKTAGSSEALSCTTVPNPPTGLVTSSTTAYNLKSNGKLGFAVGTIALNTSCQPGVVTTQGQRKYYDVNAADVTPTPTGRVVAECAIGGT